MQFGTILGLSIPTLKPNGGRRIWGSTSRQLSGGGCPERSVKEDSEVQWGKSCDTAHVCQGQETGGAGFSGSGSEDLREPSSTSILGLLFLLLQSLC